MKKYKKNFKKYWFTIILVILAIALYWFLTEYGIANPYLFPKIESILKAMNDNKHLMFLNLLASFSIMIPSIAISFLLAIGIGTFLGLNKKYRDPLYPIIYALSVIPSILLSPFVLLLAPNFRIASVFLIVYGTMWTTLFATITGVMTVDKKYIDKANTLELKGVERLVKVILPAASPSILSGFVSSLRSTFVMLVYAEMYGSSYGMGHFVKKYTDFGIYTNAWAGFIFLVIVLIIIMQFFEFIKARILHWTTD